MYSIVSFYDLVSPHEDPLAERTPNIVLPDQAHPRSLLSQQKDHWIENIRRECEDIRPTAPYVCGRCQEDLDDKPKHIGCEGPCHKWFHTDCVDITDADFQQLLDDISSK